MEDALIYMSTAHTRPQSIRNARSRLQASGLLLLVAAAGCVLGGCSSTSRPDGPPQARAYAPTVWQATPAALHEPRVVRDDR
ncbi:MAG: hypothetical protein ACIAS6_14630 [Phycisphaerales bacterium JB060]